MKYECQRMRLLVPAYEVMRDKGGNNKGLLMKQ